MKTRFLFIFFLFASFSGFAQNRGECPYNIRPIIDIPVAAGISGIGLFSYLFIVRNKPILDSAYLVSLSPSDVNRIDRAAAYNYSQKGQLNSDIAQGAGFLLPGLLLISGQIRQESAKLGLMYLQTMVTSATTYALVASVINRKRPYVYNPDVPLEDKQTYSALNSFFAGHASTVASATFFTAKVFHDYYPSNRLRPLVWAAALVPPSVVSYYRYRAGKHFLTDIIAGIPIGAAIGIIIPELHKKKNGDQDLSFAVDCNRISFTYNF